MYRSIGGLPGRGSCCSGPDGLWRPSTCFASHPELEAPAGGIRLPVARAKTRRPRARGVNGGAAAERSEGTVDAPEHGRTVPARRADLTSASRVSRHEQNSQAVACYDRHPVLMPVNLSPLLSLRSPPTSLRWSTGVAGSRPDDAL